MALEHPTLDQLVDDMNGVASTNQWDIVCSYSIAPLNSFLKAQYAAGKLAQEVKLSTERADPLTNQEFTITYDIVFGCPMVSFVAGSNNHANLVMPIETGTTYMVTEKGSSTPVQKKTIPGGKYSVKAVVPLASVHGDSGDVVPQGQVLTFGEGSSKSAHVVLHFKSETGTKFSISPVPDPGDKDPLETYFLPVLDQYFQDQVSEVDYILSSINNKTSASGATLFTPKSFAFAVTGEAGAGALSLYIQTVESGNPPGNPSPSFQPGDQQTLPIPDGYSATIILSHRLMATSFLSKVLVPEGFLMTFDAVQKGIKAHLTKDASIIKKSETGNYIFSGYSYGGLDISFKTFPIELAIVDGQVALDWSGHATSDWSEYFATGAPVAPPNGTVNITIGMTKGPIPMIVNDQGMTIADITVTRSDFTVDVSPKSCSFWARAFGGCSESPPNYYSKDMSFTVPNLNIQLKGLDYFKDTNLLAPGSHLIKVAASEGVKTPHDFLIIGQVATSA